MWTGPIVTHILFFIWGVSGFSLYSPIRPQQNIEDKAFWRKYGLNDVKHTAKVMASPNTNRAKNVIIFIGDGMGIATHTAARIYKGQLKGNTGEEEILQWEQFPYTAFSKTYNTDHQVPDSAGTATAIFSGVKTRMAMLGIDGVPPYNSCDPDMVEKSKLSTLLHKSVAADKATGIVTNVRLTHATPGALYSHIQNRGWESDGKMPKELRYKGCDDIAKQLVYNEVGQKVNVLFGGGASGFRPMSEGGQRLDENLIDKWQEQKRENDEEYAFLQTTGDLDDWQLTDYVLGLFAPSAMSYEADRDKSKRGQPSLSHMTEQAIKRLKRHPQGFFLMVEGGLVDYAHHATNAKRALEETLELERAVSKALEMTNSKDTLIVVTADHSHAMTINGYPKRGNDILGYVFDEERMLYNIQPDGSKAAYSTLSYANGPGFDYHFTKDSEKPWKDMRSLDYTEIDFLQPAMFNLPEGDETHGGEDVPIHANGPWAHLFVGTHEQSYIAHAVEYAMGLVEDLSKYNSNDSNAMLPSCLLVFLSILSMILNW